MPVGETSSSCSSSNQLTPTKGTTNQNRPLFFSSKGATERVEEGEEGTSDFLDDESVASLPSSISSKHSDNSSRAGKTQSTKSTAAMTIVSVAPHLRTQQKKANGNVPAAVVSVTDDDAEAPARGNNIETDDDENDDDEADVAPLPPLETRFNRRSSTGDMPVVGGIPVGSGGGSVNTSNSQSMRSSASTGTQSQTSLVAGPNYQVFQRINEDFQRAMISSSPAAIRVCKMCFAALSVVFVEISLSNKSASAAPFQYTRMPSIPAGAARMLWKALIGTDDLHGLLQSNETAAQNGMTRDASLTAEDIEAFFAAMESRYSLPTTNGTSTPQTDENSDEIPIKQRRRASLNSVTSTKSLDERRSRRQPRRFSASWIQRNSEPILNADPPTANANDLSRGIESMHAGEHTSEGGGIKTVSSSGWLMNMMNPSTADHEQNKVGSFAANLAATQQQPQQTPFIIDPFLSFVRESLINSGAIDLAGRLNDLDDVMDRYDSTRNLGRAFQNAPDENRSLGTAGSLSLESYESATGFVGWKKQPATKAPPKRSRRRTQYFQIQRDMQHQYGVYLSGLPVEEGGFAVSKPPSSLLQKEQQQQQMEDSQNIDEEDLQDETMDVLKRQHDTMRRWNNVMATVCLEKKYRHSAELLKSAVPLFSPPPLPNDIQVPASATEHSRPVDDKGGHEAQDPSSAAEHAQSPQIPIVEDQKRPWIYEHTDVWPIDDAILYSLRMLPSHLMRAGRVKEAAILLSKSTDFFLGRVYALGAERAVARHRDDLTELEHRVAMALEGYVDVGGDGSSVDMKQVVRRTMRIVLESLVTQYATIEAVIENEDMENDKDKTKSGDPESRTTKNSTDKRKVTKRVHGEQKRGEVGRSLHIVAWYLGTKGYPDEAVACYKMALEYKYASVGPNHVSVAGTLHNMGNLYLGRSNHDKAIECYRGALRVERKRLGNSHMKTANTLNNLGMVYGMSCQYDKAAECYKDALQVEKAELGKNHLQVAETLNNLGIIHGIRGDYDEAFKCYKGCLRIKQRKLGPQHDECSETLFNLGIVHNKRGDYEAAVDCYQDALRSRKAKMGEDHEEVARILHCLGLVLNDMGELENSTRCYEESLRIRLLKLGDDHEDVARTLYDLGHVYNKSGDYERAMECFKGTLRVSKRKLGSKHEKISDTLHSMGLVFHKKGNLDSAMECYQEALKIRKERLGPDDLGVASTLHNMGDVQYMRNNMSEAMKCYEGAFRIRFFKLGIDNVDVAATRNNIGVVHLKNGENHKAMECFTEALRVRELRLGAVHEKCGDTLHNMGLAHKNLMEYEEAIRCYEQALCIRKAKLGESNVKIADTLYNMAIVYANSGRYSSALERFKFALRAYRETGLSDSHSSVANTLQWIRWAQKQIK